MSILAVHGGASMDASQEVLSVLQESVSMNNVTESIKILELDNHFNCGIGSNLSLDGEVECEAAYMTSLYNKFGAIGCTTNIRHPSEVAKHLTFDKSWSSKDLLHPLILVGRGAEKYAKSNGFATCNPSELKTDQSIKQYNRFENYINQLNTHDTVGVVSVNTETLEAESTVSSGGILLKSPGRLGHSCIYGSGIWSESYCFHDDEGNYVTRSVSICSSGHGEYLIKADFCRSLARQILYNYNDLVIEVINKFIVSIFPTNDEKRVIFGTIILVSDKYSDNSIMSELFVCHNSKYFPIAFRSPNGHVKKFISTLNNDNFMLSSYLIK